MSLYPIELSFLLRQIYLGRLPNASLLFSCHLSSCTKVESICLEIQNFALIHFFTVPFGQLVSFIIKKLLRAFTNSAFTVKSFRMLELESGLRVLHHNTHVAIWEAVGCCDQNYSRYVILQDQCNCKRFLDSSFSYWKSLEYAYITFVEVMILRTEYKMHRVHKHKRVASTFSAQSLRGIFIVSRFISHLLSSSASGDFESSRLIMFPITTNTSHLKNSRLHLWNWSTTDCRGMTFPTPPYECLFTSYLVLEHCKIARIVEPKEAS